MAQDFGDDIGEMLFRFMERNAENLMQDYAKSLVNQAVLNWYQARAERMGLSKEESAYLAKAMANKEAACVPFGNKNDAAYFAQVCKENDVFTAALSDDNGNGYIVFIKDDLKKVQDCVPQFSEVMTTLKNREITELLANGKPLPNKPPKGFKLVKNMPDLPRTENPCERVRNDSTKNQSIRAAPIPNHRTIDDLANDPFNHTAAIRDKILLARDQCRNLDDFKEILAKDGIGITIAANGDQKFYEARTGENGEILDFDKDKDWSVNAKTLAGDKYQCDVTLDWFEKNTPKEPVRIEHEPPTHVPIPPQKDLNLICNAVRGDLEERGIETRDRTDGKMGFHVDIDYKQQVVDAVESRFPGHTPEELGIILDPHHDIGSMTMDAQEPQMTDGSLDMNGSTPDINQGIESHDGMDTATNTARMERNGSNTDVPPSTGQEQSDRSREGYNLKSKADECRAASRQLSQTNDSPADRDISDKFQQER